MLVITYSHHTDKCKNKIYSEIFKNQNRFLGVKIHIAVFFCLEYPIKTLWVGISNYL